jgi:hypothetical protein
MDIWSYEERLRRISAWLFDPSQSAEEQMRRQKLRIGYMTLSEAIKSDDIGAFAAACHYVGNLLKDIEPLETAPPHLSVVPDGPATTLAARYAGYPEEFDTKDSQWS